MGEPVFEGTIEGHIVRVDIGPLVAWESSAWLAWVGLVVAIGLVLAAAGWGAWGLRGRAVPWLGAALPIGGALGVLSLLGADVWLFARHPGGADALELFPELASRFDPVGDVAWATVALGLGGLGGVVMDLPAFATRRWGVQAGRATLTVAAAAVGIFGYVTARPALEHRVSIQEAGDLPWVAPLDDVALHAGRSRPVELESAASLARRREPSDHWFLRNAARTISDPGSLRDQVALETGRDERDWWTTDQRDAWGLTGRTTIEAPDEPGPFRAPARFRRGPVEVEATIEVLAVRDAGDPGFPLEVRDHWVWTRARRGASGPVDEGTVTLDVDEERIANGFRELVVEVVFSPTTPADGGRAARSASQTLHVVAWDGAYRLAPRADGELLLAPMEPLEAATEAEEGRERCRLAILGGFSCECRSDPVGPHLCARTGSNVVGEIVTLGLGVLTAGLTWILGVNGASGRLTELRLREVNGQVFETASHIPVPPPPRRRGRRR